MEQKKPEEQKKEKRKPPRPQSYHVNEINRRYK